MLIRGIFAINKKDGTLESSNANAINKSSKLEGKNINQTNQIANSLELKNSQKSRQFFSSFVNQISIYLRILQLNQRKGKAYKFFMGNPILPWLLF